MVILTIDGMLIQTAQSGKSSHPGKFCGFGTSRSDNQMRIAREIRRSLDYFPYHRRESISNFRLGQLPTRLVRSVHAPEGGPPRRDHHD